MMNEEQNPGCQRAVFGERFEFEGHKFIVVSEVADGFVLAVKAEDEAPAPIYLLPAPHPGVEEMGHEPPVQESRPAENDILLWTSGSCLGNPGPGGWAYVRQEGDGVLAVASGSESDTTMTRIKIRAVIEALNALPQRGSPLVVYTDSPLMFKTMNDECPPKTDLDLWDEVRRAATGLTITWQQPGAGAGLPENDRYSRLAESAAIHQARSGGRA